MASGNRVPQALHWRGEDLGDEWIARGYERDRYRDPEKYVGKTVLVVGGKRVEVIW